MVEDNKNLDNEKKGSEILEENSEKEVSKEEEMIKNLIEERDKYYNNWLRAEAELDNLKKRVLKEKEEFRKFALEGLIKEILTPIDYLEMALDHIKSVQNTDPLIQGVEYTIKSLLDILKSYGVEQVVCKEKFDPSFFEAAQVEEREDLPEGTVIKEHRKAYTIQGRLLRAGIVTVSKKPEKRDTETEINKDIKED